MANYSYIRESRLQIKTVERNKIHYMLIKGSTKQNKLQIFSASVAH